MSEMRAGLKTAYDYAAFYGSMLVFGLLCLSWSVLALPLYALLPRRYAIACGRYGIMAGFRLYSHWLAVLGVYRLDVSAIDTLRDGPPVILAPNHPSLIDAPLILARHPNLTCVMKSDLTGNLLFGPGARLARYIRNNSALQMVREQLIHNVTSDTHDTVRRPPGVSAELRTAGLVTVRRDGRSMIYAAQYDQMNALLGFLTENCCAGASAVCARATGKAATSKRKTKEISIQAQ